MATIFVYDGVPGGVGIAQLGYEQAEEWWLQTRALLTDCPCAEGCPACVSPPVAPGLGIKASVARVLHEVAAVATSEG
jgi:DEAD/DEAH box helicase domain-containing protein